MEIIETTKNECRVLIVKGKVDVLTAPKLRETIMARIEAGALRLLLDCSLLDYMSSAGLRVLYETFDKLEPLAGRLALCAVNSNVRKVLDAVDICEDIPAFATEAEALQYLTTRKD